MQAQQPEKEITMQQTNRPWYRNMQQQCAVYTVVQVDRMVSCMIFDDSVSACLNIWAGIDAEVHTTLVSSPSCVTMMPYSVQESGLM